MSYNKEELLGIISRMQQAGESEENIAAVIKEYNKKNPKDEEKSPFVKAKLADLTGTSTTKKSLFQEFGIEPGGKKPTFEEEFGDIIKLKEKADKTAGNMTGSSVDATVKPETTASNQNDTDSQLGTGSSDLQSDESWGSRFQSFYDDITLQPDQVSQIQTNIIPEKDLKQVEQIDENKKKQSDDFLLEMDKAFQPKGSLFGKIIDRTKNINIQEAATLNGVNPQQYLTDIVKEELGGMSNWFFDQDSDIRKNKYPNLSNDEILGFIEDSFYKNLDQFKSDS